MKRSDIRVAQKWNQKWSILYRHSSQTCAFIWCRVRTCWRGRRLKRRLGQSRPLRRRPRRVMSRVRLGAVRGCSPRCLAVAAHWLERRAVRALSRARVPAIGSPSRKDVAANTLGRTSDGAGGHELRPKATRRDRTTCHGPLATRGVARRRHWPSGKLLFACDDGGRCRRHSERHPCDVGRGGGRRPAAARGGRSFASC
jgi:hypothetical protein